jgi:hypothetical protein
MGSVDVWPLAIVTTKTLGGKPRRDRLHCCDPPAVSSSWGVYVAVVPPFWGEGILWRTTTEGTQWGQYDGPSAFGVKPESLWSGVFMLLHDSPFLGTTRALSAAGEDLCLTRIG